MFMWKLTEFTGFPKNYDRGKRDRISSFVVELLSLPFSLPFDKLLLERRLLMLSKILRSHLYPNYLKALLERGTSLRSSLLQIPELSSTWSHRCPVRQAIIEWNKADVAIRHCVDISRFRRLTHNYCARWVTLWGGAVWGSWQISLRFLSNKGLW